jgi:hypothetical protein
MRVNEQDPNQKFKISNQEGSISEQLQPFSPSEMFSQAGLSFRRFRNLYKESTDNTPIWHAKATPVFSKNKNSSVLLECNEEIISETKELDEQLDQIGDSFRVKMNQYRATKASALPSQSTLADSSIVDSLPDAEIVQSSKSTDARVKEGDLSISTPRVKNLMCKQS